MARRKRRQQHTAGSVASVRPPTVSKPSSQLGGMGYSALATFAIVVIMVILGVLSAHDAPTEPHRNLPPAATPPSRARHLEVRDAAAAEGPTADEQRLADAMHPLILENIAEAAGTDAQALGIVEFYRHYAVYAFPRPGGNMLILPRKGLEHSDERYLVIILLATPEEAQDLLGIHAEFNWMFMEELHAVLLPPNIDRYSRIWNGVITLHEMYHAQEFFVTRAGGSYGSDPMDPRHVAEEIRAHQMTERLLDGWTHGSYGAAVRELREAVRSQDPAPGYWFGGVRPEQLPIVDHLFPPSTDANERGARLGQYALSLDFLIGEERGLGDEARQSAYRAVSSRMFGD